jgi:hypothetical protein
MKTIKISKTVLYVLFAVVLTASIPIVVAYGQKKEVAADTAMIDINQMTVDAKNLPILQVDQPY